MREGTRLGRYEILSTLGRGGMGEVWRARDTRLDRDIAIKLLPEPFAGDAHRLARLQREARLLASVSHPNIAVLYDLEQAGEATFLALELVEGETLADRLLRGPIPASEALTLALQIAEALEAAHERGVIHRDLKPANIKITPNGKIKVLDFGLAKAFDVAGRDTGLSNPPTVSVAATGYGVILGTAAYMAPEQARGEPADARADVWAFGCVLFEMLAGQGAFPGETMSDVLAAVLKVEPDWSRLPKNLHPLIRHVLERCLEKRRRDRFAGISDARVDIQKTLADPRGLVAEPVTESPQAGQRRRVRFAAAALGAVLVSALVTAVSVWQLKPLPPAQVMHFVDELSQGPPASVLLFPTIDVSRDGTQIAYFAGEAMAQQQLYVRAIDDPGARLVDGVAGNLFLAMPRFSPDGQWLAYRSDGQLLKVPVDGGTPQPIVSELRGSLYGFHWDDDRLVYAISEGIYEVAAAGGEVPRPLILAGEGEILSSPQRLPGGDAVLFTAGTGPRPADLSAGDVVVQSLASGERTVVARSARDARYVRSGHIVYAQGTALYAVAFDLDRLEVTGAPVRIVEDDIVQAERVQWAAAQYAVSEAGKLVYLESPPGAVSRRVATRSLVWVYRDGAVQPIDLSPGDYSSARVSPDGERVVLVEGEIGESRPPDLWILELATGNRRQLTFDMVADAPVWSHDSKTIYFRSSPRASATVYSIPVGGGAPALISPGSSEFTAFFPSSLTPDGETLLLMYFRPGDTGIVALGLGAEREFQRVLPNARLPAVSPKGALLAYVEPSAAPNIKIRTYPDVALQEYPVAAGNYPVFSADGRELYFVDGDALRAVPLEYEPDFRIVGPPRDVFRGPYSFRVNGRAWDVHPDGRFLVLRDAEDNDASSTPERQRIHIVVNWIDELRRRVPAE